MGLCKCPKKKVTNQFCFEHRVNVCEYCMVGNHPRCVIQSYLLWLQDSDYNPNCSLCSNELNQKDCIRLLCYHVYHWDCIDKYARSLPQNTAPAGYSCPSCQGPIFPATNVVSPIADQIKSKLSRIGWAREGLGLPLFTDSINVGPDEKVDANASMSYASPDKSSMTNASSDVKEQFSPQSASPLSQYKQQSTDSVISIGETSNFRNQSRSEKFLNSESTFSSLHKVFDTTDESNMTSLSTDHDDNKYKKRSAFEWFSRWYKSRIGSGKRKLSGNIYKRYAILAVILFFVLVTLIMILSRVGRMSAENDPMLDPKHNPVIKIRDD